MKNNVVIFFIVFITLKSSPHPLAPLRNSERGWGEVKIAGQNVKVELAMTPEEQALGLSGRDELKEDEGMLFVFSQPGNYPFWMKDMNFEIDIIWISEDKRVIYIKKDARPESYPEIYGPENSVKYVLEVVSGFSDKNDLQVGDGVLFTY